MHISIKDDRTKKYLANISPVSFEMDYSKAYLESDYEVEVDAPEQVAEDIAELLEIATSHLGHFEVSAEIRTKAGDIHEVSLKLMTRGSMLGLGVATHIPTITPERLEYYKEIGEYVAGYVESMTLTKSISGIASTLASTLSSAPKSGGTKSAVDGILEYIKEKTQADVIKPKETLDDYKCNDTLKDELSEVIDFFKNETVYKTAGIKIPTGVLFKGPPGTGKTYAARCIAGTSDCYFLVCTASALQGQYIGSGAQNIRDLFNGAKDLQKESKQGVIIFIDEIDSLGNRDSFDGAGGEGSRTLNQLLAEMSGFEDTEGIMIMAATNYPERIDGALMRSGRFGRQIHIDYPDEEERRALVEYYFGKIKMPISGTDVAEITAITDNLSPADIKEISNEAGILAVRHKEAELTLDTINESVNRVFTKSTRTPDGTVDEIRLISAHEAGHVLASVLYGGIIPIKVTSYGYGGAGGFTQYASSESKIPSKDEVLDKVYTSLGGRAAEEVICGFITTGASGDLKNIKRTLKAYYETYQFDYYEVKELDQLIVKEITNRYNDLVNTFKELENKAILEQLTEALISKRVLYAKEILAIVSPVLKITTTGGVL